MKAITVVTIDDHYLVREGIRSLLADNPNIKLVGEGTAGEHLPILIKQHQPNIVLLDISMPQMVESDKNNRTDNTFRVLPAIARMRVQSPNTQVIIISQYQSQAIIEGLLDLGVRGYLLKDDALSMHLTDAIRTVSEGGFYFSEEVGKQLAHGPRQKSRDLALTSRQKEIIQSLADNPGLSHVQIAEQLGISDHTFSNHLRKIYEKLEATNKLEALIKALRLGIVSIEPMDDLPQ